MKKIIDLHCDTITACDSEDKLFENPIFNDECVMDYNKVPGDCRWAQCHAIFMPDEFRGESAVKFYDEIVKRYKNQMEDFSDKVSQCRSASDIEKAWDEGKYASILTVEGGSALAGDADRVKILADDGVKMMTLVWNGDNEIASGHNTDKGFSEFGRKVVPLLEENGIIVDVSHLNDIGFNELLEIVKKPFVATHSNARAICSHKRNLTDDMIREMVKRDCLIGLNYYTAFISDYDEDGVDSNCDYADMFYRHIAHFFELGAEKNLALGSDFDGATLPECLSSPAKVVEMYDYLLEKGLSEEQLDGIFYKNALRFLHENIK